MRLTGDVAALTAASEAAVVPDTTRRVVQGRGRLFGLERSAPGTTQVTECSFSDSLLIQTANRALAAALGPEGASFTWTSLQLNRDTIAEPHFDTGTIGKSAVVLLGRLRERGAYSARHGRFVHQRRGKAL